MRLYLSINALYVIICLDVKFITEDYPHISEAQDF